MSAVMRKEAGGRVHEATRSPFLAIPPELRLSIYEFALLESTCVTVGHAWVTGKHADVVSRGSKAHVLENGQEADHTLLQAAQRTERDSTDEDDTYRSTTFTAKTEHPTQASPKTMIQSSRPSTIQPSSP